MSRTRVTRAVVSLALGAALAVPIAVLGADKPEALRLRAFAVDLNNAGRTRTLDIVIERWSTPDEIKKFQGASTEGGDDALLRAMQKTKPRCGYVRTETSIPWDLYLASETPLTGGSRRIVVATDRPVGFWEAFNPSRLNEYKFSLAEIRLGPDGKGEGKAIPYAQMSYDKDTNTFEVENYETLPVRLTQVTVVGGKKQAER
jgi:hypothetical protein